MDPAPAVTCPSCGLGEARAFCPRCGQRIRGRLDTRAVLAQFVSGLANLEHGLFHTLRELTLHPGAMLRGYIAGRTVRLVPPATLLLLVLGLYFLLFSVLGVSQQVMSTVAARDPASLESGARLIAAFERHGRWLQILQIPLLALAWRLFLGARVRYAECFVFGCYVMAYLQLLTIASLAAAGVSQTLQIAASSVVTLATYAYVAWAGRGAFELSWWAAIWRILLPFLLTQGVVGAAVVAYSKLM
jgi:hypothetical protein